MGKFGGSVIADYLLLSICIPAYNRPVWLRRGLASIAESSRLAIEVVITDDLETDQGRDVAAEVFEGWDEFW